MAVDENFIFIHRALLAAAEQRLPATHDLEQLSHRCDAELVVMYLVAFITDNAGDLSALLVVLHVGETPTNGVPKKYGHMIKMLHGPQKKYCDVIEILALSGCVVSTILQAQKLSRAGSQGGHRD